MKSPVIILGAPRSGTTILGDILALHSKLHFAIEPNPLWKRYVSSECDYFDLEQERGAVGATRELFAAQLVDSGKQRLLEKTPQNCLRVPFVHAVFPDAKFVHIIRDGVESSLSIAKYWETNTKGFRGVRIRQRIQEASFSQLYYYGKQAAKRILPVGDSPRVFWGPVLPGMGGLVKSHSILEVAALQWRYCVEQATYYGRRLPSDQYMELRLEDFHEATLKRILDFAGLEHEESVLQAANELFVAGQTTHRQRDASESDIELVRRWIEPTMSWLGQSDSRD
ncbi:MAG: sulfotransferase family protein [Opitutales bacterium]